MGRSWSVIDKCEEKALKTTESLIDMHQRVMKGYWMALEGDQEALNDSVSTLTGDRVVPKGMDRCLRVIRTR